MKTKAQNNNIPEDWWEQLLERARARRPLIVSWIESGRPQIKEPRSVIINFGKEAALAAESLTRPNNLKIIQELTNEILGDTWQVTIAAVTTTDEQRIDSSLDPKVKEVLSTVARKIRKKAGERGTHLAHDLKTLIRDFLKGYSHITYVEHGQWEMEIDKICRNLAEQVAEQDVERNFTTMSEKILEMDQKP